MIQYTTSPLDDATSLVKLQVVQGRGADVDSIAAWFAAERGAIEQAIGHHGGVLVRGFECLHGADSFSAVMAALGWPLMDYVGGTSPRRTVHGDKIMTATELPPQFSIPLHQEMSYTMHHPDRIAFFCDRPADHGGQTTVGDMRSITELIDASVRHRFVNKGGVQLRRTLPSSEAVHKKPGVPKPWTEVFGTTDACFVEEAAAQRGWRASWLDDGSVQLWQEVCPAVKGHRGSSMEVWFNQAHIFAPVTTVKLAQIDARHAQADLVEEAIRRHPEMLDRVFHGDGTEVAPEDALHVFEVMMRAAVPIEWEASDLLILDNVLYSHGRKSFQGDRLVLTAMARNPVPDICA